MTTWTWTTRPKNGKTENQRKGKTVAKEKLTSRTVDEAMDWAKKQRDNPTQDWTNLCQKFSRSVWNLPVFTPGSSAKVAWNGLGGKWKHRNDGDPRDPDFIAAAPRGVLLYSTAGTYGHVAVASKTNSWSNDAKRRGKIDNAKRDMSYWPSVAKEFAGWICGATINGVDYYLNLGQPCGFVKHAGKHGEGS